jgi:enoyl-CoA hydratase
MEEYKNIRLELEDGIATIYLNRPKALNALSPELIDELNKALSHLLTMEDSLHGIILTGEGDRAFAAGADIKNFPHLANEGGVDLARQGVEVFGRFEKAPVPVIAAINGFALGGGLELAMACHIRIASENARFGQPEAKLGLTPGYSATQRLTRYIGKAQAMHLLLTCEMINAERALQLGLINEVVQQSDLLERSKEIIRTISKMAPLAVKEIIHCVNAYYDPELDGSEEEILAFGRCMGSEDLQEGVAAFIEKRSPKFKGR